jgi:predicted alpha/beta-fold hydrolase
LYALSQLEWLWAEPIRYTREEIPAFDAPNVLFLDWAKAGDGAKHKISHQQGNDAPVVLFIHGLGDDREIPYMKRCIRLCLQRGYRAAVFSCKHFSVEVPDN